MYNSADSVVHWPHSTIAAGGVLCHVLTCQTTRILYRSQTHVLRENRLLPGSLETSPIVCITTTSRVPATAGRCCRCNTLIISNGGCRRSALPCAGMPCNRTVGTWEGQHNLRRFQLQLKYLARQSRAAHKGSRASWPPQRSQRLPKACCKGCDCSPTTVLCAYRVNWCAAG
jgi:hypothetical protein